MLGLVELMLVEQQSWRIGHSWVSKMWGLPDNILFFTISFLRIYFSFTFLWPLSLEKRAHACNGDTQIQCQHCGIFLSNMFLLIFKIPVVPEVPGAPYVLLLSQLFLLIPLFQLFLMVVLLWYTLVDRTINSMLTVFLGF